MKRFLFLFIAISFFAQISYAQVSQGDFDALVALYNATGGDNWTNNTGWNINGTAADVTSDWYGVTVSGGRVSEINLASNNLVEAIPAEIGDLTALTRLGLSWNEITSIPTEIGNLSVLTYLLLRDNRLTSIPNEIGNLTLLNYLDLADNNQLTSIPNEIGNLTSLISLWLSFTRPTSIPNEIGNLKALKSLDLHGIQLTSFPPEIWSLNGLNFLDLGSNQLTKIPVEIGNLTALEHLVLQDNQLTSFPPEIGNLVNLQYFHIGSNILTNVPIEIGNLTALTNLNLENNQLTSIPSEIGNLNKLKTLYLWKNKLSSLPSEIGNLSSIYDLRINLNYLTSLPDLSKLNQLDVFYIFENSLDFGDLEALNIDWTNITYYSYSPQDTVGESKQIYSDLNNELKLVVEVGGEHNVYKWFKDGVEIANSDNDTLIIENFSSDDKGIYTCEITNTVATELTLISHPIHVMITGVYDIKKELVKVFPNPSTGQFNINLSQQPGKNTQLKVIGLNGKTIYQQKLSDIKNEINIEKNQKGTYLLQIIDGEKVYESYKILLVE